MLSVQKFGGSSLSDAEGLETAAKTVAKAHERGEGPVVVVSARGDTSDRLIDGAKSILSPPPERELDVLLSTGELESAAYLAMKLIAMGYDCVSLSGRQAGIKTDASHGSARIVEIDCTRIRRELSSGKIVVVTGFQGIDELDDVTTLGRGGSDLSATALAAALGASCEIYSDVEGIYTADPRLVAGAKKLRSIDYRDMLRLAEHGSQVLMARSVKNAMENKLPLWLKKTGSEALGTLLCCQDEGERPDFAGVTRNVGEGSLCLVGKAVTRSTAEELYALLSEAGIFVGSMGLKSGAVTARTDVTALLPALRLVHKRYFE